MTLEGEFLNGRPHGKITKTKHGKVSNVFLQNGQEQSELMITNNFQEAYYKDGMAMKALQKV